MVSISALPLVVLHLTIITTFLVFAALSKIFGSARQKRPLYKLYYVSSLLIGVSMVLGLLGLDLAQVGLLAMVLDLAGVLTGCAVTYFYWEWLPRELARG